MPGSRLDRQITSAVALALLADGAAQAAPMPVVDATPASPVTAVSREQLERLPVGRRLEDLIRTCPSNTIPTVSRQPDILIDGKPLVDLNCVQPADLDMIEVYKAHNIARAEYGAPPLVWDPVLVQGAQGYVNVLSRTGQLIHASREGRGTVRENISQGLPNYRARQLMDNWLNERRYFFPGTFPNVSTTGDWYQVGHFSQMIWPTTTTIGCARGMGAGSSWLVCRYNPGGNKDGKLVGVPPVQIAQVEREQEFQGASSNLNERLAKRGSTSGGNHSVRPRLIGGDYGGKIAQGETPRTELPWHPDFNPRGKRPEADQGVATSLYGLGIYAGIEPLGSFSVGYQGFDRDPDQEYVGLAEAFAEIRIPLINDVPPISPSYEYGYDGGLFVGYDMGSFRLEAEVAYKQADLESFSTSISLPGEMPPPSTSSGEGIIAQRQSLFDLGIYGGGAYATNWFEIPEVLGTTGYARTDPVNWAPIEDLLFRGSWAEGYGNEFYWDPVSQVTIGPGASLVGNPQADAEVDTKVEQPRLQSAEVFNSRPAPRKGEAEEDTEPDVIAEEGELDFYDYETAVGKCDLARMDKMMASLTAKAEAAKELVERVRQAAAMGAPTDPSIEDANKRLKEAEHWLERAQRLQAHCPPTGVADTKVEQPTIQDKEAFKPEPPAKLDDPL